MVLEYGCRLDGFVVYIDGCLSYVLVLFSDVMCFLTG